ncbi:hypothetical protein D3C87_1717620 [compost metagenome]
MGCILTMTAAVTGFFSVWKRLSSGMVTMAPASSTPSTCLTRRLISPFMARSSLIFLSKSVEMKSLLSKRLKPGSPSLGRPAAASATRALSERSLGTEMAVPSSTSLKGMRSSSSLAAASPAASCDMRR